MLTRCRLRGAEDRPSAARGLRHAAVPSWPAASTTPGGDRRPRGPGRRAAARGSTPAVRPFQGETHELRGRTLDPRLDHGLAERGSQRSVGQAHRLRAQPSGAVAAPGGQQLPVELLEVPGPKLLQAQLADSRHHVEGQQLVVLRVGGRPHPQLHRRQPLPLEVLPHRDLVGDDEATLVEAGQDLAPLLRRQLGGGEAPALLLAAFAVGRAADVDDVVPGAALEQDARVALATAAAARRRTTAGP